MTDSKNYVIGLVIYSGMTALDIVGLQQVFSGLPGVTIHRLWKTLDAISTDDGMQILPDTTMEYDPAPPFDVGSPEKAGSGLVNKAIAYATQNLFQDKEGSLL